MKQTIEFVMPNCSVCGQQFEDDIRFLNHMMEKHGFRNPNIDKPDRNSRGYWFSFADESLLFFLIVAEYHNKDSLFLDIVNKHHKKCNVLFLLDICFFLPYIFHKYLCTSFVEWSLVFLFFICSSDFMIVELRFSWLVHDYVCNDPILSMNSPVFRWEKLS